MAVGQELLELDLYGLLGSGEKATEREVLVAPITEKGQTWRDIYLPGAGHLWMDTNTARVFGGGTVLRNFSASLAEVPVFVKTS